MIPYSVLPHLNALLNATCAVLLISGYSLVRKGEKGGHHRMMVSAFAVSILFFSSYLIYHARFGTTRFQHAGLIRAAYLLILFSHTILAMSVVPLAVVTLVFAVRKRFQNHKRIARWTFPVWLYVSITGIVVYVLLYHF